MSRKRLSRILGNAYRRCAPRWWGYAVSRTRRPEDADEVLQDGCTRTLVANPDLESEEEAEKYVWTVLRTTSVPKIGIATRRLRTLPLVEEASPARPDTGNASPLDLLLESESQAERERMAEMASNHLQQLPEELREAVELHVLGNPPLTLRQLASKQGVGKSTAGERVNRGLDRIRRALLAELAAEK